MALDAAIKSALDTVPDCLAVGYIDMNTGMLLEMQGESPASVDVLETVSIAISNLFQGHGVQAFEKLLAEAGDGAIDNAGFSEVTIFSGDHLFVFLKARDYQEHVVCFVCRGGANPGMVMAKSQMSLGKIAEAV
ncbi:hypothetical protein ROA7450_01050 [Roseovarius albus]|uniref:Roadblock/LC7 domain protein n=1 Tax=Roseovarius albus TaxID=1247867 RepID=A0A1X6YMS9_9RHOB|nr:hypothetical protein [Roseovarius albus]SLN25377.1 hypothetical protein ROA7450_01050 [Roseovarius albus]